MARPQQDPQIRINEILDAAETLFYDHGYHQTMISDIVKKIGAAQGTFYYYIYGAAFKILINKFSGVLRREWFQYFSL